jgi:putative transposase
VGSLNSEPVPEIDLKVYDSVSEARASIGRYLDFYNRRRPH